MIKEKKKIFGYGNFENENNKSKVNGLEMMIGLIALNGCIEKKIK